MAYSFQKMFFIGQYLKHVHMTYLFLELLVFCWLILVDIYCLELFLTTYKNYCMRIQTSKYPIMKQKQTFSLVSGIDVEKSYFFNVKLKFFEWFYEHIFRSSCSHLFFKIGAIKNFAIFWIKIRLQHRCFCVNIVKLLRTAFL